ncbi:MAG TPA: hypothetical protein VER03_24175 [Bryobacteraceae bacterium]|nr:hypothetical protein [Bryobacteraceae bacterium]
MARAVAGDAADYIEGIDDRSATPPRTSTELASALREELAIGGCEPEEILEVIRSVITPGLRHNGHPRLFSYVASPSTPITAIGTRM